MAPLFYVLVDMVSLLNRTKQMPTKIGSVRVKIGGIGRSLITVLVFATVYY